jgi:TfoX/Sxy family transcriptional regulator of competence genes
MAYDEKLADRIRDEVGASKNTGEIKMFGGLCWTVNGNMAVGVMKSELLVRVPDGDYDKLLKEAGARAFDFMSGRTPRGILMIGGSGIATKASLKKWVARGVKFAESLPPKKAKARSKVKPKKK